MFTKFFHRLLNPHCPECEELERETFARELELERCSSCENLRIELAHAHEENRQLLEFILTKPEVPKEDTSKMPEAINTVIPWHIRRKQKEADARVRALSLKKEHEAAPAKSIEELEAELKIGEDNGTA